MPTILAEHRKEEAKKWCNWVSLTMMSVAKEIARAQL